MKQFSNMARTWAFPDWKSKFEEDRKIFIGDWRTQHKTFLEGFYNV